MKFRMTATVERVVTDTISMVVNAENELLAMAIAESALLRFPDVHDESAVSYCYIENRENHEPTMIEVDFVQ